MFNTHTHQKLTLFDLMGDQFVMTHAKETNEEPRNRFGPREAGDGKMRQGATGKRQAGNRKMTGWRQENNRKAAGKRQGSNRKPQAGDRKATGKVQQEGNREATGRRQGGDREPYVLIGIRYFTQWFYPV